MDHMTEFRNLAASNVSWDAIFNFVEYYNMNIPACLALAIKLWAEQNGLKCSQIIYNMKHDSKLNKRYEMYADGIEKYLMLV